MDYPAPRYPSFKEISPEELRSKIRTIVSRPEVEGLANQPHAPRYGVKEGNRVLVVSLSEFDQAVIGEFAGAFRNLGATVDMMTVDSTPSVSKEKLAVLEASSIEPSGEKEAVYTRMTNLVNPKAITQLVDFMKYDLVVSGTAGPLPRVPFRWARMEYISREEYSSPQVDFPFELQLLIDRKVYESIKRCVKVRVTDPEGTDFTFTNYDDGRPMALTHEYGKTINFGHNGKEDCSGVIAGTLNHLGAFPRVKAHLNDSLVVRVEGGGEYGDVWRQKLEDYNKMDFPEFPMRTEMALPGGGVPKVKMSMPGFFWYWECAIGTVPGVFRLEREGKMMNFANFLHDRKRAGYLHHGFGGSNNSAKPLMEKGLPWTHVHIHNMFATYEGTAKDGSKVKVIDKGHLTALDDPEVVAIAKKFGDPKALLGEVWIPAVPGVNVEGSYEEYSANPTKWIVEDARRHPVLKR